MDLLKKCQELYEELKTTDDALTFLENKLSTYEKNSDEHEENYREQFKMAMSLVNCYQNLQEALDVLEKDDNMSFFVKRMRKNSADLLKVEVIDVSFDV